MAEPEPTFAQLLLVLCDFAEEHGWPADALERVRAHPERLGRVLDHVEGWLRIDLDREAISAFGTEIRRNTLRRLRAELLGPPSNGDGSGDEPERARMADAADELARATGLTREQVIARCQIPD